MMQLVIAALAVLVVVGVLAAILLVRRISADQRVTQSRELARKIVSDAEKEAETKKREAIIEAKDEALRLRKEFEKETKERRAELGTIEKRLLQKEEHLDSKETQIEQKEKQIQEKLQEVDKLRQRMDEKHLILINALEKVAEVTKEEAKTLLLKYIEKDVTHEAAVMIKKIEEEAHQTADRTAKQIITMAIQKCAVDHVVDSTVTVVQLPNEDMKGRIIGREGRNIRTFENLTGVDLIIDDTPEAVVISAFDPIRREVARSALTSLVVDGRIHPARVEEMVNKATKELEAKIWEYGESAAFNLDITNLNPKLIRLMGRLHFRTSYGQNVLQHSIEVAYLSGLLAQELGVNVKLAKRAGLLHDIGKAVDHEVEGTHHNIGAELAQRYGETPEVVHAISAHHNDVEAQTIEAVLVMVADAISASRPGARRESLEAYIKRLKKLEVLADSFEGVGKSYAIQAGREVRIIVKPEVVDDVMAAKLAHDIARRIETELEYPGQVKVTVIRETRAADVAK
jgi:ribonuclease Y